MALHMPLEHGFRYVLCPVGLVMQRLMCLSVSMANGGKLSEAIIAVRAMEPDEKSGEMGYKKV